MYKGKTFVALIPARGGSVGIPKKNIYPLNGCPLISYTTEAASKSKLLDEIYCSTDNNEISKVAQENKKCKIILRPKYLAKNTSKSIDTVIHAIHYLEKKNKYFDYLILLQPTSPFRTYLDIDNFIQHIVNNNLPSCVSISEIDKLPVLMRYCKLSKADSCELENIISGNGTIRRQDARNVYYVDGALYAYTTEEIKKKNVMLSMNDSPYGFIIDKFHSIDINTIEDIQLAEIMLTIKNK